MPADGVKILLIRGFGVRVPGGAPVNSQVKASLGRDLGMSLDRPGSLVLGQPSGSRLWASLRDGFASLDPALTRKDPAPARKTGGERSGGSATRAGGRVQEILHNIPQSLARPEHVVMADARQADQPSMASHGMGQLVCHPGPCERIL